MPNDDLARKSTQAVLIYGASDDVHTGKTRAEDYTRMLARNLLEQFSEDFVKRG